ncbi:alanine:cation symporter family protein [Pseudenhygromyxa sp. WMMC2535]|uniref:alanine:cation symporter family protein n=1 Tax=Pseudenhygromyxa sp. WMMC2535 TaxID=2712867 RepID=UPI0015558654|nr:alanine:cation symporter family protein [Pseudenhygromyxa sp. WMMC2535]NVB39259.1 alanine:cation symporter family protein [Pseudenhygromyxa sp. WMMC2535]
MMDLSPITQAILVYTALAVGLIVTALTGFAQLRELPKALSAGKPSAALVRRGFLAASVGMGSVGGSILAIELGGPGAIVWMWVASLLGMGVVYAEVLLSVRLRAEGRMNSARVLEAGLPGGLGKALALVFALLVMIFALSAGSLLQTQQSTELLATIGGEPWQVAAVLCAAAAVGMAVPKLRAFVAALGPVAVILYVFALLLIIVRTPYPVGPALSSIFAGLSSGGAVAGGVAGGGLLMAMQAGFLRATLATEAGLGSAGFTPEADAIKDPKAAARAAMLAPLASGILVPTVTALAVLTASPWTGQRIDEAGERRASADARSASEAELEQIAASLGEGDVEALREADALRVVAAWVPLELPMSRGMAGSLQTGQTVVLPKGTVLDPERASQDPAIDPTDAGPSSPGAPTQGLRENYVYPMVMRGSPRGSRIEVKDGQRSILLPSSPETQEITELVYRDLDPDLNRYPAFDVRIPVDNELLETGRGTLVSLTPSDPSVDLYRKSKVRDGPYVVFGDYYFDARVTRMFHPEWGAFDAAFAADELPGALTLRSAVTSAFSGPYLDNGDPRPPRAMIAREDFDAPIGARLHLDYQVPERGMAIGKLLPNGRLMTPSWRFLAETTHAILRHKEDPSLDKRIRVHVEPSADGNRLLFTSAQPEVADFIDAGRWANYTGPYLDPPPYRFEVEVHSGTRAPASNDYLLRTNQERSGFVSPFAERRTLVPTMSAIEAQGSRGQLYDPHPEEVAPFMAGPFVAGAGIERLGWASFFGSGHGGEVLLGICVLILALTTMIAWSSYGARAADHALGRGASWGFRVVFVLVGFAGASASLELLPLMRLVDSVMIGLLALNGLGLVLAWLRLPKSDDARNAASE